MEAVQEKNNRSYVSFKSETSLNQASAPLPDLSIRPPAYWESEQDEILVCRQVREETHDVKTFILEAREPRQFRYQPGQFITLELEIDGTLVNRCYTLSSTPTRPDRMAITVKRVPGGLVSNWLHDNLRPGNTVHALGPSGEFSCFRHDAPKYLFLSAGSGITPVMSMSRALHDLGADRNVVFVHNARTPTDVIFSRELQLMARHNANFRHTVICERPGEHLDWHGFLGRLTRSSLENIVPDIHQREIFVCGPTPYMEAVRSILTDIGIDFSSYHEESFSFDTNPLDEEETMGKIIYIPANDSPSEQSSVIRFAKSDKEISCSNQQTILSAAKSSGMRIPASCSQGLCGTCKTKKISGDVRMNHSGGIRQREIDQGWILPCCSIPLSDVVLDR